MVVERIKSSREASRTDSLEPLMQEERCSFWYFEISCMFSRGKYGTFSTKNCEA